MILRKSESTVEGKEGILLAKTYYLPTALVDNLLLYLYTYLPALPSVLKCQTNIGTSVPAHRNQLEHVISLFQLIRNCMSHRT